jgi:beta-1,2-mannobiose phosphorylase / 1,2-beta-oligomannan phosphorylase
MRSNTDMEHHPGPSEPVRTGRVPPAASSAGARRILLSSPVPRSEPFFTRAAENPLLAPTSRWWESKGVFNPGIAEGPDGTIHILYRAMGNDMISRFGYARTRDGVTIEARSAEPVFEPELGDEYERLGIEDPRITVLDGGYYITYTAASRYGVRDPHVPRESSHELPWPVWRVRVSLAVTDDFQTFTRYRIILPEMDNKDAVLLPEKIQGKYVLLHRLPPDIWIAYSENLRVWEGYRAVLRTRPAYWDERRLGAGAPPIRVPGGWLLCYHGSDHHNVYRAGFVLLDANDPSRVLGRSVAAALEPRAPYELTGLVPRVVFPTGLVLRGDTLLLYYGAADRVIGVARGSLRAVLASLR